METLRLILALPRGGSTIADRIDLLHGFVIGVTMLVSTYVFVMAAWFTVRYHRKRDDQLTERVTATRGGEAFIVVSVLGMFLLWWVIGFRQYVDARDAPEDAEIVYVDAKQWMWKFAYADGRASNDVLTVPLGRPIKLVMISRDVIHSFYVPGFRVKQDVLPGRYTTLWFEAKEAGSYPIWCAEYCGVSHSAMRGEVRVLDSEDYAQWKRAGDPTLPGADCGRGPGSCGESSLLEQGRVVAERRQCVACHTLDGHPHIGPTWARLYGSEVLLADGRRVVADDAYLTRSMMDPNADVVAGYRQLMPSYRGALSSGETAALVELIRSLRDGPVGTSGVTLPRLEVTAAVDGGTAP
ncbi:MAG: cytochrome c oxidase subunit II [Labilithrix sp.]|nr:cytochrome c oxidase subunit II [Labilithrix sp.]